MSINYGQADRLETRPSDQASRSEIRSIDPWKHTSEKRLERILSSSSLAGKLHPAEWGAVKQSLLDRELRLLALTDDLTCLYNRRGFFATATPQLKLARRNGQVLSLFFATSTI
jgi:GGDEF domain-containing protein